MDLLPGLRSPACIINESGKILMTNSLFAELSAPGTMVDNICTHFWSDVYADRNFSFEKIANDGMAIELLIHDGEYIARVHAYEVANSHAYLVTLSPQRARQTISGSLQAQLLRYSVDCIKLVDSDGMLEYMNRSGCIALGVQEGRFGMRWLDLLPEDVRARGQVQLDAAIGGAAGSFPGRSADPTGVVTYWDNLLMPVNDASTGQRKVICVSRNVTAEVEANRKLKWLSESDDLTGLFNRRHLNNVLERYFAKVRGTAHLFLIDLDHFKAINDGFGHHAGDYLLGTVAKRWVAALPPGLVIARVGGDEFSIFLEESGDAKPSPMDIIRAIREACRAPIEYEGHTLACDLSIGYVSLPEDANSAHAALVHADTALRSAKHAGKARCCRFVAQRGAPQVCALGDDDEAFPLNEAAASNA